MKVRRGTITVVGILILSLMAIASPGVPSVVVKIGRGILIYAAGVAVCFVILLIDMELRDAWERRGYLERRIYGEPGAEIAAGGVAIFFFCPLSWLGVALLALGIFTTAVSVGIKIVKRRRASNGE